jgi:hypothetical protein
VVEHSLGKGEVVSSILTGSTITWSKMTESEEKCWICRAPADSAEHKIKKSELVRVYGKGPWIGGSAPVHVRNGKVVPVQGPNSARLKYQQSLCHDCNTTRTQPYDLAYERFTSWLFENESVVLGKRLIDFEEVYGHNFEERQRDLFKYFVKSLGCQIVYCKQLVPYDLVDLLPNAQFKTWLKITFAVNEDILLMPKADRDGFIGDGGLIAHVSKSDQTKINGYTWTQHTSWFTVFYWYAITPKGGLGSTWIANAQHVYLGSVSNLTEEQRAELLVKVRQRETNISA